jgi:hypothetical protein
MAILKTSGFSFEREYFLKNRVHNFWTSESRTFLLILSALRFRVPGNI